MWEARGPVLSYRLDQARAMCERYHITDALSWLLERMGDIPGAMRLLLQAVHEQVSKTLAGVRRVFSPRSVVGSSWAAALIRDKHVPAGVVLAGAAQAHETERSLEKAMREVVLVVRTAAQLAHRNSAKLDARQG